MIPEENASGVAPAADLRFSPPVLFASMIKSDPTPASHGFPVCFADVTIKDRYHLVHLAVCPACCTAMFGSKPCAELVNGPVRLGSAILRQFEITSGRG